MDATGAESETDAPVTDCDKYAASPLDPERKAEGVSSDKVNADLAIPACESVVAKYPKSVRLMFQLCRAYYRKKDFISAAIQYRKAAELGYLSAQINLSYVYSRGEGAAKDDAAHWYPSKELHQADCNFRSAGILLEIVIIHPWQSDHRIVDVKEEFAGRRRVPRSDSCTIQCCAIRGGRSRLRRLPRSPTWMHARTGK